MKRNALLVLVRQNRGEKRFGLRRKQGPFDCDIRIVVLEASFVFSVPVIGHLVLKVG